MRAVGLQRQETEQSVAIALNTSVGVVHVIKPVLAVHEADLLTTQAALHRAQRLSSIGPLAYSNLLVLPKAAASVPVPSHGMILIIQRIPSGAIPVARAAAVVPLRMLRPDTVSVGAIL